MAIRLRRRMGGRILSRPRAKLASYADSLTAQFVNPGLVITITGATLASNGTHRRAIYVGGCQGSAARFRGRKYARDYLDHLRCGLSA